jgi:hypothetical protein
MTRIARFAPLLVTFAAFASAAENTSALPKESPFKGPATAAAPTQAAETIEFAGVSAVGKRTDLIIYDKAAKKSHWIGVGETKDGISVVNYDARREQAVVKINGAQKVLPLRKGTGPVNTPAGVTPVATGFNVPPQSLPANAVAVNVQPAPAPAAPAPSAPATNAPAPAPGTPEAQVKQETEARMLVSDLLEIGMAQRKAYEEAQRKAAEGNTAQPAPAANPPAATPAPEQPKQQ